MASFAWFVVTVAAAWALAHEPPYRPLFLVVLMAGVVGLLYQLRREE